MIALEVSGRALAAPSPEPALQDLGAAVTVKAHVTLAVRRDAAAPLRLEAEDEDIVELQMEGGAVLWLRPDELAEATGAAGLRGEAGAVVRIGPELALDGPGALRGRRGPGRWAIRALRLLGIDLGASSAARLARTIEDRAVAGHGHGLFRWDAGGAFLPFEAPQGAAAAGPWLVFLHGTASSTAGSFGDLPARRPEIWTRLRAAYGDRVLALEHRTLTESPAANALALLRALPEGAELHLVSHSRGGLVGELIARVGIATEDGAARPPFDAAELALFDAPELADQRAELEELAALIAARGPRVTRFVRTACPARGTSLMGERLDRWLNLVFNVLSLVGGGRLNPALATLLDGLKALGLAVVRERTNPATLPGLLAMAPEGSPLLRLLNRPDAQLAGDLAVIAGDIEAGPLLQRLVVWFADAYFGDDHDLVIDTASMDGGLTRSGSTRIHREQGAHAHHFAYFGHAEAMAVLAEALLDPDALRRRAPQPAPEPEPEEEMPVSRHRSGQRERPVVFLLPGIQGSHLRAGGRRVWISPLALAGGGIARLAHDAPGVEPDGMVASHYADLFRFLDQSHQAVQWPYDWRRSILETADRFAAALQARMEATRQPVRIVAHSMGGLVARAAFARHPGLWQRFRARPGARLVMLGTPNGGSWSIPMLLMGRNRLMRWLAALDFRHGRAAQLAIVAGWPGTVQMLPVPVGGDGYSAGVDLFAPGGWARLAATDGGDWTAPSAELLAEARAFRALMDRAPADREVMAYVAGQDRTYGGMFLHDRPRDPVTFGVTNEGDGQVLWFTGRVPGVRSWFADAAHGDLARHRPAFAAILDLLQTGVTARLSDRPPQVSLPRAAEAMPEVAREEIGLIPDATALADAALGSRPAATPRADAPVALRIRNAHLRFARHPLVVGHYAGDPLSGSEQVLDAVQEGRIDVRMAQGLHPGPLESFEVHLDATRQPPGSLIVGLGEVADLSGGRLRRTLARGLIALGLERAERGEAGLRGVSLVLLGSGNGVVALGDCLQAILRAVRDANAALGADGFEEVELIEHIGARAVSAWHDLAHRLDRAEFRDRFALAAEVEPGPGAWNPLALPEDPDWWVPITVRAPDAPAGDRTLQYVVVAGRARAEARMVASRRAFVDAYVARITRHADPEGPLSAARTLFEILWPNALKEQSLDDRNIRLILDEEAATLPWEMLDDRRPWVTGPSARQGPPAVRHGVIRQLVTREGQSRERLLPPGRRRRALVIGDPGGGGGFGALPGAEAEARRVTALLQERGYDVTALIGPDVSPEDVVSALFADAWDILHIAAHGVVDHRAGSGPARTGIVLGEGPDGPIVLESDMLEQLPATPRLVVVNCCSLGALDAGEERAFLRADRPALARSIAVQLIRMGVPAVVVAGWEVADIPAQDFAERLHAALQDGASFGRAVKAARADVWHRHPGETTWGAYQAYGSPDFRLLPGTEAEAAPGIAAVADASASRRRLAAPAEAVSEAGRLVALHAAGGADPAALERLDAAVQAADWLRLGAVAAALGLAWEVHGDAARALSRLELAGAAPDGGAPVAALDRLCALRAARLLAEDAEPPAAALDAEVAALEALDAAFGPRPARLALQADLLLHRAALATGTARRRSLDAAVEAATAAEAASGPAASDPAEPAALARLRALAETLRALLHPGAGAPELPDLAAVAALQPPDAPPPEARRAAFDLTLLHILHEGRLPEDAPAPEAGSTPDDPPRPAPHSATPAQPDLAATLADPPRRLALVRRLLQRRRPRPTALLAALDALSPAD